MSQKPTSSHFARFFLVTEVRGSFVVDDFRNLRGWKSRQVYLLGPDNIQLDAIKKAGHHGGVEIALSVPISFYPVFVAGGETIVQKFMNASFHRFNFQNRRLKSAGTLEAYSEEHHLGLF